MVEARDLRGAAERLALVPESSLQARAELELGALHLYWRRDEVAAAHFDAALGNRGALLTAEVDRAVVGAACARLALGDPTGALAALGEGPGTGHVLPLALAYVHAGRASTAQKVLDHAGIATPEATLVRARIADELGQPDRAEALRAHFVVEAKRALSMLDAPPSRASLPVLTRSSQDDVLFATLRVIDRATLETTRMRRVLSAHEGLALTLARRLEALRIERMKFARHRATIVAEARSARLRELLERPENLEAHHLPVCSPIR